MPTSHEPRHIFERQRPAVTTRAAELYGCATSMKTPTTTEMCRAMCLSSGCPVQGAVRELARQAVLFLCSGGSERRLRHWALALRMRYASCEFKGRMRLTACSSTVKRSLLADPSHPLSEACRSKPNDSGEPGTPLLLLVSITGDLNAERTCIA